MEHSYNFLESSNKWTERKEEIRGRLVGLIENPVPYEMARSLMIAISEDSLWNTYSPEKKDEIIKAENEVKGISVVCSNLAEFRYGLELLHKIFNSPDQEKEVEAMLSHENAHMNTGEALGLEGLIYTITPYGSKGGKWGHFCAAWNQKHPEHWSIEKSIEVGIAVNNAPETYDADGRLSEYDTAQIDKLKSLE